MRELLGDDPDADAIAERLDSAVGTGTSGAVGEEVFWAVRKLAEALAQDRPLVLVFEDVHWGEPTLLDLIEHLADWVAERCRADRLPRPTRAARRTARAGAAAS